MRYHFARPLPLLLGIIICCLGPGCSNSEYTESTGWEYTYNDTDGAIGHRKQDCFNSFRLPDQQSTSCKKIFYSKDTITDFPGSGFFQKTFTIALPNNNPLNCEIGGKEPTRESPLTSILHIDSSMTIRCAMFSEGTIKKTEIIRTYILESKPTVPAVFITTDPNSLFNPDTGIYMEGPFAKETMPHRGANYWLDKEIPIFIEFLETETTSPAFTEHAGLQIFGNYSRAQPKKSVSITFRKKYGKNRLHYKLFPNFPELNTFKGFILRNNGQNFPNDYIRDRLVTTISDGLNIDYQRGRFVVVYYNSNYFGIHDLRERANEYYFETHYGISSNNINLLKADDSASAGSSTNYKALMNWLTKNSLEMEKNYKYLSTQIDINNYINYLQ